MNNGEGTAYNIEMLKVKLTQKCSNDIQFVTRQGQSVIICLSSIYSLLTEKWYKAKEKIQMRKEQKILF